jgi:transposase
VDRLSGVRFGSARYSVPVRLIGTQAGVWPVQAQRALRGLIHAWHAAREQGLEAVPAGIRGPLEHEFRHAGLASVPRPKHGTKQKPGRELLEFCRDRRSDVLLFTEDTSVWPTNNRSSAESAP